MARSSHWPREAATPFHLLQQELHRLLDQYIGPVRFGGRSGEPATDLEPSAWSPPVDVYETPEELLVLVEVPGVDPASIDLAGTGQCAEPQGRQGCRRPAGTDDPGPRAPLRRLPPADHAPNEVDFDKAEASIDHGVLKIRLPKQTAAQTRTIPVRPA